MSVPLIAIIGRPNVGKSTLFNRILGAKTAIVDDVPGVTRDRNYADGSYRARPFRLVDTGGLDPTAAEGMLALIKRQSELAIAEADILVFVMDGRSGLTAADEDLAILLRRVTKPVFLAINKIDTGKAEPLLADFYQLGFDQLHAVSAEHGLGVSELLDDIYPLLPDAGEGNVLAAPRIAIIGRPNVGKSTLINTLIGEERVVVSDLPGTTRDAIDTLVTLQDRRYVFTDTAGIRRRGRIEHGVEVYSVNRAVKAMGRSDVVVLLLDAVEGITEQDTKIAGMALKQGRACVVFVNKWDLRADDADARMAYSSDLQRRLAFLAWAPVLFGSALKREAIADLLATIDRVHTAFTTRIPTGALNEFLQGLMSEHPLPVRKGKPSRVIKSVFMTQVTVKPPTFAFFVGHPEDITPTYLRFLENRLRLAFPFPGTPLRIMARRK